MFYLKYKHPRIISPQHKLTNAQTCMHVHAFNMYRKQKSVSHKHFIKKGYNDHMKHVNTSNPKKNYTKRKGGKNSVVKTFLCQTNIPEKSV